MKRQKPQDIVLVECGRGLERNKVVDFLFHLLGFYNVSALYRDGFIPLPCQPDLMTIPFYRWAV